MTAGADIEWIGLDHQGRKIGIVRVGPEFRSHKDGDPYEAGCLVTDEGDTALLWFAHPKATRFVKAIFAMLREQGYRKARWTRDTAHGLREVTRVL
jgi:hypothetical protein